MSPTRHADAELDALIDEITVDAHDEDEQLIGFEAAFDEDATFPCPGTVIGEQVEVLHVSRGERRHELIATCERNGNRYEISLLDVNIHGASRHRRDPELGDLRVSRDRRQADSWDRFGPDAPSRLSLNPPIR